MAGKKSLYKRAKKSNLVQFTLSENVTPRLKAVGLTMRSPTVTKIVQEGAEMLVTAVQARAPMRSGLLRQGVYSTSSLKSNYRQLTRRGGAKVNSPLKRGPRLGQVLVVSSVFYQRWVEKGREANGAYDVMKAGERRVGVQQRGRKRGRPFFRPAVRAEKPRAEMFIVRRIDRLLGQAFEDGRAK